MAVEQLGLGLNVGPVQQPGEVRLPKQVDHILIPPIKCQGIKTKLAPFILSSVQWNGRGKWIEPFIGSGVVLFNLAPPRAYATDTNVHIIRFYRDLASGALTPALVREYLECAGALLRKGGDEYYYEVRERFNANPSSLDFLFLNRACFNGLIRFNRRGGFNVPFGKKPERFRRAYITKIVNQVAQICRLMEGRDWVFEVANWRDTIATAEADDFVYADPPYIGRHTDYYNNWTEEDAAQLLVALQNQPAGFALSMWLENKYRRNTTLDGLTGVELRTMKHFYHVGATENLRNEMEEALVIRHRFAAT